MKAQTPTVVASARQFWSGHFVRTALVVLALICVHTRSFADWPNSNATKWVQLPDTSTNGIDILMSKPLLLADDFLCTNTGPVTDVHLWTSWLMDETNPVPFTLSIWSDVPTNDVNPYSHPGDLLWTETITPDKVQARAWYTNQPPGEWFWDPRMPQPMEHDLVIWQYNVYPTNPFRQQGTPGNPMVYWLSVTVPVPQMPQVPIGWKTSTNHWNDDAVWVETDPQGNPIMPWKELRDPFKPTISLDLAFALTTEPDEELLDFGDAPDQPYPTLLASNGARHAILPNLFLGALIDAEADGQPNATAAGDDLANLADEDGVAFNTPLIPGQAATVTVTASAGGVPLNAWVDFGADGSWLTPGDQIFSNAVLVVGPNVLNFPVPANAALGPTFARFRYSTMPNLPPTGAAPNGEVEDYRVQITQEQKALDFGDAPDQPYPTLLASNGARHTIVPGIRLGQAIDPEGNGQPNATATGDDTAGVNDEDGITFVGTLIPGQPYNITVNASVPGFLSAWVDFNADGSWAQAIDQVFASQPVPAGPTNLTFTVPPSATWGATAFARFRYTTVNAALSFTGLANDGEVEDYALHMEPMPQHDLGDAPSSFNNSGHLPMLAYPVAGVQASYPTVLLLPIPTVPYGPFHAQPTTIAFLGANVSFESNADIGSDQDLVNNIVPPAGAADQDGADDGVVFPLALPHCGSTTLNYTVTLPGTLPGGLTVQMYANVWFDWNRDGDWNDVMICPDGSLAPEWAVQNQMIPVPASYPATVAMISPPFTAWHPTLGVQPIWMRITLADQTWSAPGFSGLGGDGPMAGYGFGETEDYFITDYDAQETFDFGDAPDPTYPTLLANSGAQHLIVSNFNLGNLIDAEADGQSHTQARGDDTSGLADEDGVILPGALLVNTQSCATVFLTGPAGGLLDGWVDFNGNGAWDASEQVFTNLALTAGPNPNLCFAVPLNARFGPTFARFRLSSAGSLLPFGAAQDGEVEDYAVRIAQARPATNVVITNITVTSVTGGQAVTLNWNAETNLYYQVQAVTTLTNSPLVWTNVSPLILGPQNSFTETNTPTAQRYYRVAVPFAWP